MSEIHWPDARVEFAKVMSELEEDFGGPDDKFWDTTQMLVAAFIVGANQRRIQKLTGLPAEFIRERAERLRASRIWGANGHIRTETGEAPDGVEFALWGLVAEGILELVPA